MKNLKMSVIMLMMMTSSLMIGQVFEDNDSNDDGRWDENEFTEATGDSYNVWDTDNDQAVDDDEFYDNSFNFADDNNDSMIDEEEWDSGIDNSYGAYADSADFGIYDENDDGFLDNDEWNEGFSDSEWFDSYDENTDGVVDNDEVNTGLFEDWDHNNDGFLDENEYANNEGYFDEI